MRLSIESVRELKELCNPTIDIHMCNLIETIEAQQQEIDRLKATLDDWKYNTKCDADHIAALTADKDEQTEQIKELIGGKEDAGKK